MASYKWAINPKPKVQGCRVQGSAEAVGFS